MDELRPFQDPDLSSLQAGSACLAKQQDGLWYPARITGEAAAVLSDKALPGEPCCMPPRSESTLELGPIFLPKPSVLLPPLRPLTWPVFCL